MNDPGSWLRAVRSKVDYIKSVADARGQLTIAAELAELRESLSSLIGDHDRTLSDAETSGPGAASRNDGISPEPLPEGFEPALRPRLGDD